MLSRKFRQTCYILLLFPPEFFISALGGEKKPRVADDLAEMDNIVDIQCREEDRRSMQNDSRESETPAKGIRREAASTSDRTLQAPGMGETRRAAPHCYLRGPGCGGKRWCDQGHYAAGRDLDDPVALALHEPAQHRIRSSKRSDIDGRKCEASGARSIEHLAVGFVIGDWHGGCFGCCAPIVLSQPLLGTQSKDCGLLIKCNLPAKSSN